MTGNGLENEQSNASKLIESAFNFELKRWKFNNEATEIKDISKFTLDNSMKFSNLDVIEISISTLIKEYTRPI